jgi:Outer membrane protein beta-barrel domain
MKKNAFLTLFILLLFMRSNAQNVQYDHRYHELYQGLYKVKIGFRFSPAMIINALEVSQDFQGFKTSSINFGLSLGPIADLYFTETTAFSTGLLYTFKKVDYSVPDAFYNNGLFKQSPLLKEELHGKDAQFNLSYLQVPVTLKLFSNGLLSDCPAYLQFGGVFDWKVVETSLDKAYNPLFQYRERIPDQPKIFRPYGFNLIIGFGGETCLRDTNDTFFFGLQYQKGITKINNIGAFGNLVTDNGMLMLDFGLKF